MTLLSKKLNVKEQGNLVILNLAEDLNELCITLEKEAGVKIQQHTHFKEDINWILIFVKMQSDLASYTDLINRLPKKDMILWFAYPKKSSKIYNSDISRDQGWSIPGNNGWEPVRMIAINENWSALRFRRVEYIRKITRNRKMALTEEAKSRTTNKR